MCLSTFTTEGNWRRHELETHLVTKKWVCAPYGSSSTSCPFCERSVCYGWCRRFATSCSIRSTDERSFMRRGQLLRHLADWHKARGWSTKKADEWRFECNSLPTISQCGFCYCTFTSWKARMKHLAVHFKGGWKMKDWNGPWGFSQDWYEIVMSNGAIEPQWRSDRRLDWEEDPMDMH